MALMEHAPQDTGANLSKSIRSDKELQDEIRSLGTGSFTTNTFNARLQGSAGMKILKYIQSEQFGQHGESLALIETIQVRNKPSRLNGVGVYHEDSNREH